MTIKQIFISAILIRLLLMPFLFHPDIKDIALRTYFFGSSHIVNIYDYLKQNPVTRINAPDFAYPPLAYFVLGSYEKLASPLLGGDFSHWLFDFSGQAFLSPFIYRYMFILKLPYLICDLLIGWLLMRILTDPKQIKRALLFWFFNPLNLYAIYAIGQFDIIPSFLTLLSWYLWEKDQTLMSGIALGFGASFKSYPLMLIPFFLLDKQSWPKKIRFVVVALGIYGFTILPFINSINFRHDVLFSGLSQRVFDWQFSLAGVSISVFLVAFVLLLFWKLIRPGVHLSNLITSLLITIYVVSRFHPQWIVWLTPFLTVSYVKNKLDLRLIGLFILGFFLIFLLFNDSFLLSGLLAPISRIFTEIPAPTELLSPQILTLAHQLAWVILAIPSLLMTVKLLKQ